MMKPMKPFASTFPRYALAALILSGGLASVPARAEGVTESVFNFLGLGPDESTNKYPPQNYPSRKRLPSLVTLIG